MREGEVRNSGPPGAPAAVVPPPPYSYRFATSYRFFSSLNSPLRYFSSCRLLRL